MEENGYSRIYIYFLDKKKISEIYIKKSSERSQSVEFTWAPIFECARTSCTSIFGAIAEHRSKGNVVRKRNCECGDYAATWRNTSFRDYRRQQSRAVFRLHICSCVKITYVCKSEQTSTRVLLAAEPDQCNKWVPGRLNLMSFKFCKKCS